MTDTGSEQKKEKALDRLWSVSTTIREAERIAGFLKTAVEMEGQPWTKENQTKFQILLIKNRQYLNNTSNSQTFDKLSPAQCEILRNSEVSMSYEQAKDIFESKDYLDPPMRGRQSMSPLVKLGLVFIIPEDGEKANKKALKYVRISDVGKRLASGEILFEDFILDCFLKYQYPNPLESGFKDWNTKPFINVLRLIKRVNELCTERGTEPKGISKTEFGIFCLSLKSYKDVNSTAERILDFRAEADRLPENELEGFVNEYIKSYLVSFNNPVANTAEYTDNMIRYIRLTRYIYIRGKFGRTYVDLEPRRMTEINSVLEHDDGSAKKFTKEEWMKFMGTYNAYVKPFETVDKLQQIFNEIMQEICGLETSLSVNHRNWDMPDSAEALIARNIELREYRTDLQTLIMRRAYRGETEKINEVIQALEDIVTHNKASLKNRYSIELEKWVNIALNILDDAKRIHANASVGDDNEIIYTAPGGVPDIECYYEKFSAICEVTTLTSRQQWYNEGQPVQDHLRKFETSETPQKVFCLFVAPSLHANTVNTFYTAVKYEFEGMPQSIIPITIRQLIKIMQATKLRMENGLNVTQDMILAFYRECCDMTNVANSAAWLEQIQTAVDDFISAISEIA